MSFFLLFQLRQEPNTFKDDGNDGDQFEFHDAEEDPDDNQDDQFLCHEGDENEADDFVFHDVEESEHDVFSVS